MKKSLILTLASIGLCLAACNAPSNNMVIPGAPEAPAPKENLNPVPELPKAEKREDQRAVIPHYDPIEPDKIEWITMDGGNPDLDFNPKMDILFVIDNSGSMKATQENLSNSINSFASAFQKYKMIDYHLGVTSVWDSHDKYVNHPKRKYDSGELRRVKINGAENKNKFLTRETGTSQNLRDTIKIGIAGRAEGGTPVPEFEETFTPLSAAIKLTGRGAANEGFFRSDAHLVVILVTDADDTTSQIRGEQLAQELLEFKNGTQKLSVYGVLVRKSDPDSSKDYDLQRHPNYHPECFSVSSGSRTPVLDLKKCPEGYGPEEIESLIIAANPDDGTPGEILSKKVIKLVQRDFGPDLARIGADVSMKTLDKEILLDQRVAKDKATGNPMIELFYGTPEALAQGKGQKIPYGAKGWKFDPSNNSIHLAGDVDYDFQPGSRFMVRLVPLRIAH